MPRPEQGGSIEHGVERLVVARGGGVAGLDLDDRRRAEPLQRLAQRGGASRVALDRDDGAVGADQLREVARLAAGRGAEVEHAHARLRRQQPRRRLRRARLRDQLAGGEAGVAAQVEGAVGDQALWQGDAVERRGTRHRAPSARERLGHGARATRCSVLTRSALSAGSLTRASSARAPSGPSACHHSRASQSGTEYLSAAVLGLAVAELARAAAPALALRPPQDGVDEPVAAAAAGLRQLDALVDGRVRRDAVEEQQLQQAEPQRVADGRVELRDGPSREPLDQVVERAAALHGAVGERGREGVLAALEPGAGGLAGERAIGVRAVLLDPPQDRGGDPAGGRNSIFDQRHPPIVA